jgi:hypothetical protein
MNGIRTLPLVVAAAFTLAACGDGDSSTDAAAKSTPSPAATATASASPEPESAASSQPTPAPGKCDEVEFEAKETSGTAHPAANFFEPDATNLPTEADLGHLLLRDNAVVVLYASSTPKKTRDRLNLWWYEDVDRRTPVVVPDPSPDALPVRARIATVELRCNGFDWERLTKFANRTDIAPLSGHG